MEMELSSLPPSIRTRLQPKLRQYRVDYEKLRADLKSASAKPSERDQLFGGLPTGREDVVSNDQRSRLLVGTNKLNDASRRLEDSHRIALETEEIGASTLETLRNQRQQILRATDTVNFCEWKI
jgi:vesicle transport through interaction with t-SNAREs protein 1